jgi:hypothetical protein
MGKFTGEVIYDDPQAQAKPAVSPALVKALVPPTSMGLSPQDQRALNVSEANRRAEEQRKIAEEKRATQRKIEEENRATAQKLAEEKRKEENPMASLSEGERKASTLLQRLQFSQQQLNDVLKANPDAAKPEYLPTFLEGISETGANLIRSEPRQQIETAQMDLLDAALTLGTGASYTKEQLKGYSASYFPKIGDSPKTIKDKEARLANIVEAAKIAAGRGAKLIPEVKAGNQPPVGAPPTAKQAPDGKWYAPDPARPGKYLQY